MRKIVSAAALAAFFTAIAGTAMACTMERTAQTPAPTTVVQSPVPAPTDAEPES